MWKLSPLKTPILSMPTIGVFLAVLVGSVVSPVKVNLSTPENDEGDPEVSS
jgi:hypothetical protein